MMTIPAAIAFWWSTADHGPVAWVIEPAIVVSVSGALLFVMTAKEEPDPSRALALLTLEIVLVAYFSGATGSSGRMLRWLANHGCTDDLARTVTFAFRKTVHFTFYGTVGATGLAVARRAGSSSSEAVRTALFVALCLASFDELRQSGYASRTGSFWDVLLDGAGASTFVGLLEMRRRKAR